MFFELQKKKKKEKHQLKHTTKEKRINEQTKDNR